ncbi:MFS general substrate transporter [Thozetella sp. PMI_491]|nr:MFS general substrate transporter [Thozetella sp. PMI_491]
MTYRSSDDKDDTVAPDHKIDHVEAVSSVVEIESFQVLGLAPEDAEFYLNYPAEKRKKVVHKVDMRLVPMLSLLYLIAHIDRANIGNAKVEGLAEDLGMTDLEYNTILSVFFVPYVLFEVPSNVVLKKFKRPSVYLGSLVLMWGIVMTLTGVVRNYGGLMATRVILGALEAGFFPGAIYLCSYWYMPKDLATRISYFYCASALSGAFSGLLAAAIAQMDGIAGYQGWRWIFIIEGLATILLGVACFVFLIDSPALSTRWLEPDEIRFLELQLFIKQGGKFHHETGFKWRDLTMTLKNWRLYLQAYFLMCQSATSYGTKFTLPTITKAMGFSNTNAQLMSAPPYIAGAISSIFFARMSDRFNRRMPFVVIPMAMMLIAYSILLGMNGELASKIGPSYFAIVLSVMGIYPIQPAAASWNSNNLAPANRRAIGIALNNCIGNTGGIIGSFMYKDSEKPKYFTGFGLSLAFAGSGILVALFLEMSYKWANAEKAKMTEEEMRTKYTADELLDMGDKSPLFKYVL